MGFRILSALILVFTMSSFAEAEEIRALYVSSSALDTFWKREKVKLLLRDYEPNAVVINLKDDSGNIIVNIEKGVFRNPYDRYVSEFRAAGASIFCRVVVFKELLYASQFPHLAIKKNGETKELWKNNLGEHWMDPSGSDYQKYLIRVSKAGIQAGCRNINFDYIRFPSGGDGNTSYTVYPFWRGTNEQRRSVIAGFLARAEEALGKEVLSGAMFGYAFHSGRGVNIGQDLLDFARHVKYGTPMVYPSHWECGTFGFADPNKHPYEVYKQALAGGLAHLKKNGTTMPLIPYIQAFSIKNIYYNKDKSECLKRGVKIESVEYGREMFRSQIRACQEFPECKGWIAWNPWAKDGPGYPPALFNPKKRP